MAPRTKPKDKVVDTTVLQQPDGSISPIMATSAIASVIVAVIVGVVYLKQGSSVLVPLKAPKVSSLSIFSENYKDKMLWGTYRSGLYFGMKIRSKWCCRAPKALMTGLLWFDPDTADTINQQRVRHEASQGDKLSSYGWLQHDGSTYGHQQLLDPPFNISIQMAKSSDEDTGPGGDWAVRISVSEMRGKKASAAPEPSRISLIFYMVDEAVPSEPWEVLPEEGETTERGVQVLRGGNTLVGAWSLHQKRVSGAEGSQMHALATQVDPEGQLVHLRESVMQLLAKNAQERIQEGLFLELPDEIGDNANLAMFQITFQLPGSYDFAFVTNPRDESADVRLAAMQGDPLSKVLEEHSAVFGRRFDESFLQDPEGKVDKASRTLARTALSNLLGSMGHFYGSSQIRLPGRPGQAPDVRSYWPLELFTAVPSRSFFPRGFLWDEGFHQLLVGRWDPQASRDAIAHWLDTMNAQGWIPREQILGAEARARVPVPYIDQHPSHANPPSLMLPLLSMANSLRGEAATQLDAEEAAARRSFLERAWPRLEAWYGWFNSTQQGKLPGSYRWRGRDATTRLELNPKTLMSGLDDYPRASHPSDDERHLDLRCWMAMAAQAMATIGDVTGRPASSVRRYRQSAEWLLDLQLLKKYHWSERHGMFLDYGNHTEAVRLQESAYIDDQGKMQSVLVRVADEKPQLQLVPAFGYLSLFPLLLQLLPPDCPELGATLVHMRNEEHLWTPYGLRSLSTKASLYGKHNTKDDAPYWRGPIWVNINFLAVRSLHHYCHTPGPHSDTACQTYGELRPALLANVQKQLKGSGYLWEQYSDLTGAGKGSHPFAGWTALVALLVAEQY